MKMLCVLFQLVDIPFQCLNGFLQLAFTVTGPIDKGYLLFILDLVELFTQPLHGMQRCFTVVDYLDSVQYLTLFDECNDLFEQTGLMLCDGLFPDKGILVRTGFDFGSIDEYRLAGDFSQIIEY